MHKDIRKISCESYWREEMYGQLLDEADGAEKKDGIDRVDKMEWADKVHKAEQLDNFDD